jgi:hypothetical protein
MDGKCWRGAAWVNIEFLLSTTSAAAADKHELSIWHLMPALPYPHYPGQLKHEVS